MAVILFVDMLGARRRWQSGGVAESMPAFYRFRKMVNIAARRAPAGEVLDGVIETDAAMLVCQSAVEAARIAQRLYLGAFVGRMNYNAPRYWFRGCIIPHADGDFLRAGDNLREPVQEITAFRYSESALEAVSVEKSGFKGMRLLVRTDLIDATVHAQMKIPFGTHTLIPFREFNYSHYPARVAGAYTDFLWMACQSGSGDIIRIYQTIGDGQSCRLPNATPWADSNRRLPPFSIFCSETDWRNGRSRGILGWIPEEEG